MSTSTAQKEYFKKVSKIKYEGRDSDNPMAYRWYDESKVIAGKTMKEYLRFACAYWHSFCGSGADPPLVAEALDEALDGVDLLGRERPEGVWDARILHTHQDTDKRTLLPIRFFRGLRGEVRGLL